MDTHKYVRLICRIATILLSLGFALFLQGCAVQESTPKAQTGTIQLDIRETSWELRPGLSTTVWSYNGTVPGMPIIVKQGERVIIDGFNRLRTATNIHWHGMVVPNDQDGPTKTIKPGESFHYEFTAEESGTYWYHSHFRPVLTQVDMGLYGPFIVKAPEDDKYSGDHILVLDDWYLDGNGRRLPGSADGMIERTGNIGTVNGKTGEAIAPLEVREGELHKLRFINASTAAVHTLHVRGQQFRVTHTDGHPLAEPYMTDTLVLSPAERYDVELAATGTAGQTWIIDTDRPQFGIKIPIIFRDGKVSPVASPFVPPSSKAYVDIASRKPDFVLELNSAMGMMGGGQSGGMHGGTGNMGGMSSMMAGMMRWTINGKSYPDTDPLLVKVGEIVKVRFINKDTQMMHPMDHPMHIHGTYFQVVSQNGRKPDREIWKDTVNVPANEYVDIAFVMKNPGEWMLHCHILDHEDAGLMTVVMAK